MTPAALHLQKTLCAMRWIALLNGNAALARAIESDQQYFEDVLSHEPQ